MFIHIHGNSEYESQLTEYLLEITMKLWKMMVIYSSDHFFNPVCVNDVLFHVAN